MLKVMETASLYEKYHTSRQDERVGLFESVRSEFGVRAGLYPGCFVHVAPSFVIPRMYYVDSDRNAHRFFAQGAAQELVAERRVYDEPSQIEFFHQDYHKTIPIQEGSVGLLLSQYAGFVSEACNKYLVLGGYLIVNNSHGDAGLASCNREYRLVAVVNRRGDRWSLHTRDLDQYFVPKSRNVPQDPVTLANHIRELGRGIGYTKTASDYVFEKISPST
jgi:hypothetical protein